MSRSVGSSGWHSKACVPPGTDRASGHEPAAPAREAITRRGASSCSRPGFATPPRQPTDASHPHRHPPGGCVLHTAEVTPQVPLLQPDADQDVGRRQDGEERRRQGGTYGAVKTCRSSVGATPTRQPVRIGSGAHHARRGRPWKSESSGRPLFASCPLVVSAFSAELTCPARIPPIPCLDASTHVRGLYSQIHVLLRSPAWRGILGEIVVPRPVSRVASCGDACQGESALADRLTEMVFDDDRRTPRPDRPS